MDDEYFDYDFQRMSADKIIMLLNPVRCDGCSDENNKKGIYKVTGIWGSSFVCNYHLEND